MNKEEAKLLVNKYNKGKATTKEKALLEHWYLHESQKQSLDDDGIDHNELKKELWLGILKKSRLKDLPQPLRRSLWPRIAAAASIICVLSVGGYFTLQKWRSQPTESLSVVKPGSNKATLTLSNGRQISLTNTQKGHLVNDGDAVIDKTSDGQLAYSTATDNDNRLRYNVITTPVGGQYALTLSDGSRVTLNAGSVLRFPVHFAGKERDVELTGEAYFEVAHNKAMPFKVKTKQQIVEVLGTHFNISAYADEMRTKTTLLQGSVKVSNNSKQMILKPGEQAIASLNMLQISSANTEEAVAWKNGYFRFNGEHIESIMKKLSRWYDVDVAFRGDISDEDYYGTISKYKNIDQVLHMLEATKTIHFKIEGRRITVTK